jgi:hypothetical protein
MSLATMNRDRQMALAVMLKAYRVFGGNSFLVDRKGRNWAPLHHAETQGWCRFWNDRCRLTEAGIDQLADYRRTA